jgi:hypothetical protein
MADKPPEKSGRFDTGLIRELAAILREADLGEIEIELAPPEAPVVEAPEEPVLEESESLGTLPAQSTRPQDPPEEPVED